MKNKSNVLFLSHGGGPLPLLGDEGHREMVSCLNDIAAKIPKPSSILLISAHWEEKVPTITSGVQPELIYDYYGFPEESYTIKYPCPGNQKLAEKTQKALETNNIVAKLDEQRGFDHGLFIPLKIMYPKADIPCIQLSLVNNLDSISHINIGRALRNLNHENLLIVGSGFSFHNIREFFTAETNETKAMNESFENWLLETCSDKKIDKEERTQRLIQWSKAPFARYCHPREEHLLPLFVCYGVSETSCSESFKLKIMNKKSSMYLWSASAVSA